MVALCNSDVRITEARGQGGGSVTPSGTHGSRTAGLARGQPGVGAHLAGAVPGFDPHCPGRSSTHFAGARSRQPLLPGVYALKSTL